MFTARPRVFFALVPILSLLVLCVQTSIIMELKSRVPESSLRPLAPHYLKDGQCSGDLDDVCPDADVLGLSVRLEDPRSDQFGQLIMDSRLSSVRVRRLSDGTGECRGKAYVKAYALCSNYNNITIDPSAPPTALPNN